MKRYNRLLFFYIFYTTILINISDLPCSLPTLLKAGAQVHLDANNSHGLCLYFTRKCAGVAGWSRDMFLRSAVRCWQAVGAGDVRHRCFFQSQRVRMWVRESVCVTTISLIVRPKTALSTRDGHISRLHVTDLVNRSASCVMAAVSNSCVILIPLVNRQPTIARCSLAATTLSEKIVHRQHSN